MEGHVGAHQSRTSAGAPCWHMGDDNVVVQNGRNMTQARQVCSVWIGCLPLHIEIEVEAARAVVRPTHTHSKGPNSKEIFRALACFFSLLLTLTLLQTMSSFNQTVSSCAIAAEDCCCCCCCCCCPLALAARPRKGLHSLEVHDDQGSARTRRCTESVF